MPRASARADPGYPAHTQPLDVLRLEEIRMKRSVLALAILTALVVPTTAQESFSPDPEGFIRNWLVLAPIRMVGQSGAEEMHFDALNGEAGVKPSPDGRPLVGGQAMTWTPHQAEAYYIDFRQSFDRDNGEYAIGYAVTYVHADAPMKLTLALGTNDQGKAWFNGREVMSHEEARTLSRDENRIPVALVQGQNVLVLKVINEVNNWQACARFLDGDKPVTGLRISLTPQQ
jgi:hypothetical protein